MDVMKMLLDDVPSDVIVLATLHEPTGELPEFAIDGKLLPNNFVRLTSVSLHLKSDARTFPPR